MRYLIIICLMLGIGATIYAQSSVSGRIVDKEKPHAALQYATVTVSATADSTFVTASVADKEANFKIENLPVGDYIFGFKFRGYQTKTVRVRIRDKNESLALGDVALEKRPDAAPDNRRR